MNTEVPVKLVEDKRRRIEACLDHESGRVDLWALRELALTTGGLLDAATRQRSWPLLVGLSGDNWIDDMNSSIFERRNDTIQDAKEIDLIRREAGRSVLFRYLREGDDTLPPALVSQDRGASQDQEAQLSTVLETTVSRPLTPRHGKIHYYQGLHDIAGVFLFNLSDPSLACAALRKICSSHLRDALRKDFSQLLWLLDAFLLPLVQAVDVEMHDFLVYCEVELSSVVMPWLITWFSHNTSSQIASRFFDAFLSSHPLFPLYVALALLVHPCCRYDVFETECDAGMVCMTIQHLLSKVKPDWTQMEKQTRNDFLTVQELIDAALTMLRRYPPRSLLLLAERYREQDGAQSSYLRKAEFVSIFKAPPSWALASWVASSTKARGSNSGASSPTSVLDVPAVFQAEARNATARATVASGVEWLMSTIDDDAVFSADKTRRKLAPALRIGNAVALWSTFKQVLLSLLRFTGMLTSSDTGMPYHPESTGAS